MKMAGFSLRFALANNTGRDYTVPPDVKLFKRQAGTRALEEFNGRLERAFLIPAHERAQLTIQADYSCEVSDTGGHESERDEPTCFHDAFGDVSGFVALDEGSRVRLDLPEPALVTSKDEKPAAGGKAQSAAKPDTGDVFDHVAACQQADEFVALCKKQNVRPTPGSFAAYGGYADHLPEWVRPPSGYKLDATPQSCEVAMEWQNFCRRAK